MLRILTLITKFLIKTKMSPVGTMLQNTRKRKITHWRSENTVESITETGMKVKSALKAMVFTRTIPRVTDSKGIGRITSSMALDNCSKSKKTQQNKSIMGCSSKINSMEQATIT
jgi:hypothetical protein